jgi:hypothetical protein
LDPIEDEESREETSADTSLKNVTGELGVVLMLVTKLSRSDMSSKSPASVASALSRDGPLITVALIDDFALLRYW